MWINIVANLVIVLGFCVGTVGAAGFRTDADGFAPEDWSIALFAGGLVGLVAGGILTRFARSIARSAQSDGQGELSWFRNSIDRVLASVRELDDRKAELAPDEVASRLVALSAGELFDLTSRHEELVELIGFTEYARVWEGVASAERLLARVWSLTTDGYYEEALEDLPRAREWLETSAKAIASIAE